MLGIYSQICGSITLLKCPYCSTTHQCFKKEHVSLYPAQLRFVGGAHILAFWSEVECIGMNFVSKERRGSVKFKHALSINCPECHLGDIHHPAVTSGETNSEKVDMVQHTCA